MMMVELQVGQALVTGWAAGIHCVRKTQDAFPGAGHFYPWCPFGAVTWDLTPSLILLSHLPILQK